MSIVKGIKAYGHAITSYTREDGIWAMEERKGAAWVKKAALNGYWHAR